MTSGANKPNLADLYRLGEQLEMDKSVSVQDLRRRDHAIGLQCQSGGDSERLLFWLRELHGADEAQSGEGQRLLSQSGAVLLARGIAALSGFLGMMTFLLASGRGLVNVLVFLLLFVLVQLLLCCFSARVMARSVRGKPPAVLPVNPVRLLVARAFPDRRYLRECQSVVRLLLLRYGQELGVLFTLGAVVSFFGVLASSEYTFVWGSTFGVSDGFVGEFTRVLAMPWSAWLPAAAPTAELIAESRFHPALTDLAAADRASLRGWWPFLIMALLWYALLPRLLLWLLSLLFYSAMMRRSLVDFPGAGAVLMRMKTPVVETQAREPEARLAGEEGRVSLDDGLMLLDWAGALGGEGYARFGQLRPVSPDNLLQAGLATLEEDRRCAARIDAYRPENLLVAVKSWEPPMADLADFLQGLSSVQVCTLCLVALPGHPVSDHGLKDWGDFARELPFSISTAQALDSV